MKMINSIINLSLGAASFIVTQVNKILPPLFAVIITLLIIKYRMPHIEINVEKKEGDKLNIIDFNTGEIRETYYAWRFLISNRKMPTFLQRLLFRETAINCYAKIKFIMSSSEEFIMRGRWASSPQITHLAQENRFVKMLYPDPCNIKSGDGESLDCFIQFINEDVGYGWNNESYFNNWRTPEYKLKKGQHKVIVTVNLQNGIEVSKEFKVSVDSNWQKTTLE